MELNAQDILAMMGGGDENFHGTELDPEKVATFDQLKAHAEALAPQDARLRENLRFYEQKAK